MWTNGWIRRQTGEFYANIHLPIRDLALWFKWVCICDKVDDDAEQLWLCWNWVHNSAPEGAVLASHQTPLSSRSSCLSYYVIMIKINLMHHAYHLYWPIVWHFDNHDCITFTTSLVNSSRCISLASLVSHFRVHPWLKTLLLIGVAMVQILFWGEQWG